MLTMLRIGGLRLMVHTNDHPPAHMHVLGPGWVVVVNRIVVRLTTGVEIGVAPSDLEGLRHASNAELGLIEVRELGLCIHIPQLDVDLYVPALLEGALGSKRWMAAQLGAAGGSTRSPAKAEASRENGKRGGRPRKVAR